MMATQPSVSEPGRELKGLTFGRALRLLVFMLILSVIMFAAANDLRWTMAWVYLGLYVAQSIIRLAVVMKVNPELVDERAAAPEDAKQWDRKLTNVLIPFAIFGLPLVAGLDRRFGWSPALSPVWVWVGLLVHVLGVVLGIWAGLVNRFFSRVVRIQTDRGHTVATGGPYHVVRHPGYLGSVLTMLGLTFLLGSVWGLTVVGAVLVALVYRIVREERDLTAELPGYAAYKQQTRYRLLPGLW